MGEDKTLSGTSSKPHLPIWVLLLQWVQVGFLALVQFFATILNSLGLSKDKAGSLRSGLKSVKQIPGPVPLPIFGTTLTSSALRMSDLYEANKARMSEFGPIIKEEHLWGFPLIHLLDPDHIETAVKVIGSIRPGMEILSYYRNLRPDRYDSIGLSNAQGAEWEKLHSVVNPVLTSPKFISGITQASDEMALDFVKLLRKSGPHFPSVQSVLTKFVVETAFYNVLGKRMGFILEDDDATPESLRTFLSANDRLWAALHETSYGLPWWKYFPTSLWKRNTESEDTLIDVVEDLIQSFIKEDSGEGGGLLGSLLANNAVSYKTKRLLILEVIMGSSDTVISTLTFMLYWISRDARVSSKLFSELRTVFPSRDLSAMDGATLNRLPYLKACMMEVYRVCNVAPNVMRLSEHPLEVGGYLIPPYSLIVLQWGYAVMQDESFYKASEFLPERWIYDDNIPPFTPHRRNLMYPFGIGKRLCPGNRVVKLHVSILLARIFRNFKVTVEGGPMDPNYQWLIQPGAPVPMSFTEREE